jgi:hypothetical protein
MKNIIIIICASLLSMTARAQINLVLNPDLEQYSHCPDQIDEITYCTHWNTLDSTWRAPDFTHEKPGIPEYDNICSSNIYVTIPSNFYFYHYAHSGSGMMQMIMFSPHNVGNARDYMQGHLSGTLIAGHKYNVCFYTALEQGGSYAVNNIGAYLDDGTIDTTQNPGLVQNQYTPQVVDTTLINDTVGWAKVEGTFTANGTEKLITIGQFTDSAHTHYINRAATVGVPCALYLIDDVSVIDCSNVPFAGHDTLIHLTDSAFIGSRETLLPYTWYKLGSTTPIDSGGGIWVKPTITTSYVLVQQLCGVTKMDTVKVWVYPDTPNSIVNYQLSIVNVRVYPNPATGEVTVEGAKGLDVVFYDVVGRQMLHAAIVSDRQIIAIADFPNGVYLIQVEDRVSGASVVRKVLKE